MKSIYFCFLRAFKLLAKRDQLRLKLISIVQVLLGILDLVGVAFIGVLGALSISGVQSRAPGTRVYSILEFLQLENFSFQAQSAALGIIAISFLVLKTLLSVFFTKKSLFFLSLKGAQISANLIEDLLSRDIQEIKKRGSQEILYSCTSGVYGITVGILSTGVSLVADLSAVSLILFGIFAFDPTMALLTCSLFATIAFVMFKLQQERARELGQEIGRLAVQSEEQIVEILSAYRELVVHDRQDFYIQNIRKQRLELADTLAEMSFMPQVSKYIIEVSVLVGGVLISAVQFLRLDATQAFATLAIFLAAGSRIAPAVMRLQQNLVLMRHSIGISSTTFELIEDLYSHPGNQNNESQPKIENPNESFEGKIRIENLSFKFQDAEKNLLSDISFTVEPGSVVALVGPSGSGKSTLVDLMLGILKPTAGIVEISGFAPNQAIKKWPGLISYVPQEVLITKASLLENVGLGFAVDEINQDHVFASLRKARLEELIDLGKSGFSQSIQERGGNLSGGQKQRIGIARALYTNPRLIILDEATSALDVTTESEISDALLALKGEVTLVLVAHRLSTVRNADLVVYVDSGRIIAQGTFEEVRSQVPQFDKQANLLGL
jgi:ABC-type multidrug transport system fused ATPase/permease subunit